MIPSILGGSELNRSHDSGLDLASHLHAGSSERRNDARSTLDADADAIHRRSVQLVQPIRDDLRDLAPLLEQDEVAGGDVGDLEVRDERPAPAEERLVGELVARRRDEQHGERLREVWGVIPLGRLQVRERTNVRCASRIEGSAIRTFLLVPALSVALVVSVSKASSKSVSLESSVMVVEAKDTLTEQQCRTSQALECRRSSP